MRLSQLDVIVLMVACKNVKFELWKWLFLEVLPSVKLTQNIFIESIMFRTISDKSSLACSFLVMTEIEKFLFLNTDP